MLRSLLLAALVPLAAWALWANADDAATPLDERQARLFGEICATCHVQPGTGAPIAGQPDDWAEARARGLEQMLARTVNGYLGMPPLGTCGSCSEDDFRGLIRFMSGTP